MPVCAGNVAARARRLQRNTAFVIALAIAPAILVAHPCDAQSNEDVAQQRYERGVEHYRAHRFDDALNEFRASLELYASPNTRLYIARCLLGLDRLPEATMEFERVVGEAGERANSEPRYAPTRDTARAELASVERRVARVSVVVTGAPSGTRVRVAGREIPPAALGLPVVVVPGRVAVEIDAPGRAPIERLVSVAAGGRASVTVPVVAPVHAPVEVPDRVVAPPAHEHQPLVPPTVVLPTDRAIEVPAPNAHAPGGDRGGATRGVGAVVLGVGAAAAVSLVTFGALSEVGYNTLHMACPMGCVYADQGLVDRAEAFQTTASISLGVAIAGLVTGTLLVVLAPRRAPPAPSNIAR
jgi:hypothetical protein